MSRTGLGRSSAAPAERLNESRGPVLSLLRLIFFFLLLVFTAVFIVADSRTTGGGIEWVRWTLAVGGMLLFFFGIVAVDVLTPKRKLSTISAVFVGLIAGVLITAILGNVIDLFSDIYGVGSRAQLAPIKIVLGLGVCYLAVSVVLQTQDDFRLLIPYVEFAKKIRGVKPLVLDTSALVDGRVLEVGEAGLFQAPLLVPRFVIDELQRLSDSSDRLKRARGRRGLEIVSRLQRTPRVELTIEETEVPGGSVDQMLVELSRNLPATLVTTDTGLARVAAIQGVGVLNLNDLASAMRTRAIPGEPLTVELLRKGEQPGQAVGYLEDGTMVVAENAHSLIGQEATLIVASTMQTSAGRLIFARPAGYDSAASAPAPATGSGPITAAPPSSQSA